MSRIRFAAVTAVKMLLLLACTGQQGDVPLESITHHAIVDAAMPIQQVNIAAANDAQRVYYVDPSRSTAAYHVDELLLTDSIRRTVTGSTPAVSGKLLIDWDTPSNSRVGTISVDLTQLGSDSQLRDQRIRSAFLESERFPTATFSADNTAIAFPESLVAGEEIRLMLAGNLTVRDMTRRVEWAVTLLVGEEEVRVSAETEIHMSNFAVGPISIIGLLETKDAMRLTLDLVATAANVQTIAQPDSAEIIATAPVADAPEFFADIEPILAANCVACHAAGQLGHSTYAMETARDVVAVADDLAFVIAAGNMPPWPPSSNNPPFEHERRLSSAEIELITAWAAADAPIDGDLNTSLVASQQPFKPLRSDVVVRLSEPYTPKTTTTDDYRCFLLDPQLNEDRYMTGFHVIPSNLTVAHHLTSVIATRNRVAATAARREAEDGKPGWSCPGNGNAITDGFSSELGSIDSLSTSPTWTPGMQPVHFPQGSGILLEKDSVFIIQMHYNTTAGTGPDQTELHVQLAPVEASVRPIRGFDMFTPVEIPCPEDIDTLACQRDTIKADSKPDPSFAQSLLIMCGRTLDDYWGQSADHVASDCLYEVNIDAEIVIAAAHMHELGKAFNITLNPDTPHAQTVLDIEHWNFDWQGAYKLQQPMRVNDGDRVRITCVWDNGPALAETVSMLPYETSRKRVRASRVEQLIALFSGARTVFAHDEIDEAAYRYVSWGYGTGDEMCIGSLAFLPDAGEESTIPMTAKAPPSFFEAGIMLAAFAGLLLFVLRARRLERKAELDQAPSAT